VYLQGLVTKNNGKPPNPHTQHFLIKESIDKIVASSNNDSAATTERPFKQVTGAD